ncbi:NAD(P)/FAD-dependent oxidoreductase [Lignipirellula cremea]|uniref:Putative glutamate synthase subunit beta n=1 Tax=Lignipirellula cremea TaxID=2528010 RepID=A0A518DNJ6_9BACT|nr:hypothetical protein [Lignipirellula cremea]QDU93410.1 putative glutamate synthase subunit beta [Lignipirellula cremea]
MAVDTPARLAILGAGPIGLETALYARYLGYDVDIYERGDIAQNVRKWGHVRMFTPFRLNSSPLALAALKAQSDDFTEPDPEAFLTGAEWVEQYLLPLAHSDLLCDDLRPHTEVLAVSRDVFLKGDLPGGEERGDDTFRILARDPQGQEFVAEADVVIDATGVFHSPNHVGVGGAPAMGETALCAEGVVGYHPPDILGVDRSRYENQRTLVVGRGYSAATTIAALAELAVTAPATSVVWITRGEPGAGLDEEASPVAETPTEPFGRIPDDRLPARDQLAAKVNALATAVDTPIDHRPGCSVAKIERRDGRFAVTFCGRSSAVEEFDAIIANVGYRPDHTLSRELQLHTCYATEGPMKLATQLLGQSSVDCLDQVAAGPASLFTPEPNFYLLGAKSYGRNSQFLYTVGLAQIRDLFSILGDRKSLDLYANHPGTVS